MMQMMHEKSSWDVLLVTLDAISDSQITKQLFNQLNQVASVFYNGLRQSPKQVEYLAEKTGANIVCIVLKDKNMSRYEQIDSQGVLKILTSMIHSIHEKKPEKKFIIMGNIEKLDASSLKSENVYLLRNYDTNLVKDLVVDLIRK